MEFDHHETIRQSINNNNNLILNGNKNLMEPTIRRLTSESDNSSSISPSLSERSNGVSWSDQVGLFYFCQQLIFFLLCIYLHDSFYLTNKSD